MEGLVEEVYDYVLQRSHNDVSLSWIPNEFSKASAALWKPINKHRDGVPSVVRFGLHCCFQ